MELQNAEEARKAEEEAYAELLAQREITEAGRVEAEAVLQ